jgi:Tol biopolymer transport system component
MTALNDQRSSWRYLLTELIAAFALVVALIWLAFTLLRPTPPRSVTMATDPEGSVNLDLAKRYREFFARNGIELKLVPLTGAVESLARLQDPKSDVSIAIVPSGITTQRASPHLVSLGTLFYEPLWFFLRGQGLERPDQLRGLRLSIGPEGSASRAFSVEGLPELGQCSHSDAVKLKKDHLPASEPQRISFFDWATAGVTWTPGGRNIVFSHGQELWKVSFSRSGNVESQPQKIETLGSGGTWPAIAWRGKRMAFVKSYGGPLNIWRVRLGGGNNKVEKKSSVTDAVDLIPSTSSEFAPQYSPDGKKIAFESDRTGNLEIWICQSNGENCSVLTFLGSPATGLPHWSPDGSQIVFYSRPKENAQIYLVNSEGGSPRQLTNDEWENFFPVWSRDGHWIYFSSNRSGSEQIWKMPSGGGQPLQVTKNSGFACVESVDGKYLYYTQAKAPIGNLWKMPVGGGEPNEIAEGVVISNFAVTVRGLCYMTQKDTHSDIRLVHLLSSADHKTRVVATLNQGVYHGFSLSPDERWLVYAPYGRGGSNVMVVDNFDLDQSDR